MKQNITVKEVIASQAKRGITRNCLGNMARYFLMLDNIDAGSSVTRLNPATNAVYSLIGVGDIANIIDKPVHDLSHAEQDALARVVVAIEHEKRHMYDIADSFQRKAADVNDWLPMVDYLISLDNPVWSSVFYNMNMSHLPRTKVLGLTFHRDVLAR